MKSANFTSSKNCEIVHIRQALVRVVTFLRYYLPLGNAHANDFLVFNIWDRVLSPSIQCELEACSDILDIPRGFLSAQTNLLNSPQDHTVALSELDNLVVQASENYPDTFTDNGESNKWSKPVWLHDNLANFTRAAASCSIEVLLNMSEDNVKDEWEDYRFEDAFVSHNMTPKKAHEIELMGCRVGKLCREIGIDQVVDIGSGKGYLGTYLHLAHQLSVIEIDNKHSNSENSVRRRENILDKWPHLLTRARVAQKSAASSGAGPQPEGDSIDSAVFTDQNAIISAPNNGSSCLALTAMITCAQQLDDLVQKHSINKDCILTGLHTCGGLGSTIFKTFIHSEKAKALINVGCCYHLLEERHFRNPFLSPGEDSPEADFPMSDWLSELDNGISDGRRPFALGRNARIIASQCLERIVDPEDDRPLHISMFYRVVLQRILFDHLGYTLDSWVVGKLGKKHPDYLGYVRACITKLGFTELQEKLSDSDILEYLDTYASSENRIFRFYLLRCLLAPAIETCILLDRILYLLEKTENNTSVQIVSLFEAIQSPRRFAIIAVKNPC